MLSLNVNVSNADNLGLFRDLREATPQVAARALNKIAPEIRTQVARQIRTEVNFPANYLSPSGGRLQVDKKRASPKSLETKIIARERPTSLARFVQGRTGKKIRLVVKPGKAVFVGSRAFIIRLRAGTADLDTKSNLGVAIRLRPGEQIANKYKQVAFGSGLTLLYAPSVAQAALDNAGQGAFDDLAPRAAKRVEEEILRLLGLELDA